MRKQIVLVLLVPILALTLISCDADMRSSFADFLGVFGNNVYENIVKADYSGVEEATAAIAAIEGKAPKVTDGKATIFGSVSIDLDLEDVPSILSPKTETEQEALKNTIKEATNTDDKKQKFANDQKVAATTEQQQAASGTVQVINATIEALKEGSTAQVVKDVLDAFTLPELDNDDVGELTQADVLVLQLMTDMVSNVLNAVDSTTGEIKDGVDQESLINNALFAIDIAETLSGASSIDFSSKIDIMKLIPKDNDGKNSSREVPLEDDKGIIHGMRGLFPIEFIAEELEKILTTLDDPSTSDSNWFGKVFEGNKD